MSDRIRITCNHCNHVIKAPRQAAGKRGKCPHCHNSVYVPTPQEDLEEIPLAAGDEDSLARADRLEKEAQDVAAAIRRETSAPPGERPQPDSGSPRDAASHPDSRQPAADVNGAIIRYLLAMQASDLENSEDIARELKGSARQAKSKIQQMMVDAIRPEALRSLPEGLYQGFLRKLLEQL